MDPATLAVGNARLSAARRKVYDLLSGDAEIPPEKRAALAEWLQASGGDDGVDPRGPRAPSIEPASTDVDIDAVPVPKQVIDFSRDPKQGVTHDAFGRPSFYDPDTDVIGQMVGAGPAAKAAGGVARALPLVKGLLSGGKIARTLGGMAVGSGEGFVGNVASGGAPTDLLPVALGAVGRAGGELAGAIRDPRARTGRIIRDINAVGGKPGVTTSAKGGMYDTPEYRALPEGDTGTMQMARQRAERILSGTEASMKAAGRAVDRAEDVTAQSLRLREPAAPSPVVDDPTAPIPRESMRDLVSQRRAPAPEPSRSAFPSLMEEETTAMIPRETMRELVEQRGMARSAPAVDAEFAPSPAAPRGSARRPAVDVGGERLISTDRADDALAALEDAARGRQAAPVDPDSLGLVSELRQKLRRPGGERAIAFDDLRTLSKNYGERAQFGADPRLKLNTGKKASGIVSDLQRGLTDELDKALDAYKAAADTARATNDALVGKKSAGLGRTADRTARAAARMADVGRETKTALNRTASLEQALPPEYQPMLREMRGRNAAEAIEFGVPNGGRSLATVVKAIPQNLTAAEVRLAEPFGRAADKATRPMLLPLEALMLRRAFQRDEEENQR